MARVVGRDCNLDLIIDDIREELRGRPYKLVKVAGGWQHRTRKSFGDAIWVATRLGDNLRPLSLSESLVLTCIAYDSDGRRVMLEIAPAGREMLCKVTPDSALPIWRPISARNVLNSWWTCWKPSPRRRPDARASGSRIQIPRRMKSAFLSPIMMVGALVLPLVSDGMTEASAIRSRFSPIGT